MVAGEGQGQATQQDQQRSGGCVENELGGCVLALGPSPDRNQEIDRHQLQFPGEEKQQEVLGEKHQGLGRGLEQ